MSCGGKPVPGTSFDSPVDVALNDSRDEGVFALSAPDEEADGWNDILFSFLASLEGGAELQDGEEEADDPPGMVSRHCGRVSLDSRRISRTPRADLLARKNWQQTINGFDSRSSISTF